MSRTVGGLTEVLFNFGIGKISVKSNADAHLLNGGYNPTTTHKTMTAL